jgi:hypothetical protein
MTPVEETSIESRGQPKASEAIRDISTARIFPSVPVHALAIPALTRIALALLFSRRSRQSSTGAAQKEFLVKTPEATQPAEFGA